jgi:MFS family permease
MNLSPSSQKVLWYLFIIGFFGIFSTTISKSPVLPLFSQAIGANDSVIGLISAISPLTGILFSFPVGVLSDRIGRRRLLILSGAVFLVAPLLYLLVSDPFWLIPVRFFHGTATAILGPVASAIIVDRFSSGVGEKLGQYSSATLIGRTIAPLAGGLILTSMIAYPGMIRYDVVYIVAAVAAVPVFCLTLLYREDRTGPVERITPGVFKNSFHIFVSDQRIRATALADMATYFSYGAFETFFPVLLAGQGIEPVVTGIIISSQVLVIAVTKPVFGRVADRIDKRYQIVAGLVLLGVCVACIPLSPGIAGYFVLASGLGLGMSLSTVATSAYIADIARREEMGASMGGLSSTMDIGHSAGPLITGIIISSAGYIAGFGAGMIVTIIVAAYFAVSVMKQDPARAQPVG